MESERLQKVKAIFLEACDLSEDEVDAYLDKECAGDDALRAKVEALLAQRSDSGDSAILDPTPKALSEPVLHDGDLIAGRFRILKFIGRGGMGEVYRAADAELGDDVALKTILPTLVQDPQFLGRFRREVQLARQVTHPNVCRIFDVGRDQDRDLVFLTMEFLEGEPLSRMMSRKGRLRVDEAYPILKQMAVGLDALHAKGIVHRDFKPGNVMLVSEGGDGTRAVIGDFGLARAVMEQPSKESLSITGNVLGTPDYMAPEQIVGKPATPAIDVYSFGLVMFEMVTGRKPFSASKALGQAVQRVTEEPPAAKDFAADVPDIWDAVIRRCMARSAAERYIKAGEAIEDLAETRTRPSGQTLVATTSDPTQTVVAVTDVAGVKTTAKRMLWTWVAVVVALIVSIGLSPVGRNLLSPARSSGSTSLQDEFLKARGQLDHYYKPENLVEALGALKKIVEADPKFALARASLCRAYYLEPKGETDAIRKAREQCNEAIALDRDLAPPHVTMGVIYLGESKTDLAAQEIQQAIRLDARNPAAYGALSALYQAQGRSKEVEATIQKAVDLEPEDWRWHNVLGQYYKGASRFEDAAREFEKVIKLTPDNPFGFNNLGLAQTELVKLVEARKAFEQAIELQKSSPVYNNLGLVLQLEGKFDEAAEVTRKSLELDGQNYVAWGNLAFCLEFGSAGLQSAKEVYRKAILFAEEGLTKSPKDARILADLGSMYASLGEGQKGELLVKKALALDPDNKFVHRRAASVYAKSGKPKEAVKELQEAIRLGFSVDGAKRNPELAPLMKDPQFAMDGRMPAKK